MKTNSAPGPDQLPSILFNKTASSISFPLSILYRTIFDLHELPLEWKKSIIIPIFKKGSPSEPSNYRPISLTCSCCKVLETIIASDLLEFLVSHNLISKNQHGFLKKHSTVTNLIETFNDWTVSLLNRKSVVVAYVDFQRAFDVISHTKLIHKLTAYGISDNLLFWISSFLSNRTQCVRVNSSLSPWLPVISGVAQGSVLGPLLFNLFVNDLTDNFNPLVRAKLFADDLKVYSEISVCSSFQFHLDLIHAWSTTWQLPISYSKCNILVLGNSSSNINFSFPSVIIKQVQIIRDLGVLVEPDLKFISHIHSIIDKANIRSSLVFRSFLSHNSSNLLRAYKTYIRPLLEYASSTWSPSLITQIMALEMVQKKFTKRIPNISHLNYNDRLHSLKLQSLEHRRLICDLVLCYKIVHNNLCMTFTDLFKFPNITSPRRHSLQLYCPVLKSNLHKGSFAYRVISPWNSLPENIVCAPNSVTFKNRLSKFDLSKFLIFPCIV